MTIEFLEPHPIVPKVTLVNNAVDGGVDIFARGEKALFRVFASGLDDTASPENVRVHVNQLVLNPISVGFMPANGIHMIVAQIPEGMDAIKADISLQFGNLTSLPVTKRLQ